MCGTDTPIMEENFTLWPRVLSLPAAEPLPECVRVCVACVFRVCFGLCVSVSPGPVRVPSYNKFFVLRVVPAVCVRVVWAGACPF